MSAIVLVWFIIAVALWGAIVPVSSSILAYKSEKEEDRIGILQRGISVVKQFLFLLVIMLFSSAIQNSMETQGASPGEFLALTICIPGAIIVVLLIGPQMLEFFQKGRRASLAESSGNLDPEQK